MRFVFRLITLDGHGRRVEHRRTVDVLAGHGLHRLELWGPGGQLVAVPIGLDEHQDDDEDDEPG